jgi:hypothetical protein
MFMILPIYGLIVVGIATISLREMD